MKSPGTSISISLRNILLPTDFSPFSERALSYGTALARRYKATLYTVTVVPEEVTENVQPPDPFYLRHSAQKKMAALSSSELLQGIRHREFVKEGFVAETLSDLTDELEIDLLVVGTHGRSGMKKIVLGSVAEEIINSAPCPVITVGPRVPPLSAQQPKLQKILYAANLLHDSSKALAYAEWLAEQEHARLTVLHVLKKSAGLPAGYVQSEAEMTRNRLAQLLPPESAASLETEFVVESGAPGEEILKVAERQGADLIVMGLRYTPYAWASTHLPWLTAHQVICHAPCPVLTVSD